MTALAHIHTLRKDLPSPKDLPSLIERAATMLSGGKTAAEVLKAREAAGLAYDIAKRAARMESAKAAHNDLVAAAHRAQADAPDIEAAAKRRLADEYDAAQARGEVAKELVRTDIVDVPNDVRPATTADLGLRRDRFWAAHPDSCFGDCLDAILAQAGMAARPEVPS